MSIFFAVRYVSVSHVSDRPQEIACLVAPLAEEITRHWHVTNLRKVLDQLLESSKVKVRNNIYERWLFTCMLDPSIQNPMTKQTNFDLEDEPSIKALQDYLLPSSSLGEVTLQKLLLEENLDEGVVKTVVGSFKKHLEEALSEISRSAARAKKKKIVFEVKVEEDRVSAGAVKMLLRDRFLEKLKGLYKEYGSSKMERFENVLAVMMLRYEALSGGTFQVSLPPLVMDVLKHDFGVFLECFSSPLNCHFPRYCSMFPDCDFAFGSLGSFFNFRPLDGSFLAFPPQVNSVIIAAIEHINDILTCSSRPMSFIFVLHGTVSESSPFWDMLMQSRYYTKHIKFAPKEHALTGGFVHRRKEVLELSLRDTLFFFLQNEGGATRWPCTDEAVDRLKIAFAGKDPSEAPKVEKPVEPKPEVKTTAPISGNWMKLQQTLKKPTKPAPPAQKRFKKKESK